MRMPVIRALLHGGLGNQLFQFFFACLQCEGSEAPQLILYDDRLAKYSSGRSLELLPLLEWRARSMPAILVRKADQFARLRLPKLAWKLTGRERAWRVPLYGVLVDGYFQEHRHFAGRSGAACHSILQAWRHVLHEAGLLRPVTKSCITHIRLGDFLRPGEDPCSIARSRLSALHCDTDLVTDQQQLVSNLLQELALPFSVCLIDTSGMSAWQLLSTFSSYSRIDTNGSSLAFWAAVLANSEFSSVNQEHVDAWRALSNRA